MRHSAQCCWLWVLQVVIGLTTLAFRYEGLRLRDVRTMLSQLKQEFNSQAGPRKARPAYRLLEEWVEAALAVASSESASDSMALPAGPLMLRRQTSIKELKAQRAVPSLEYLQPTDAAQVAAAHELLRLHPPAIEHFLSKHVFPACTAHQEAKLSAR